MKNLFTLLVLSLLFVGTASAQVFADNCVKGEISYNIVSETDGELIFDVFLKEHSASTCGSIYLGNMDVVFDFNAAAFTAPMFTKMGGVDPALGIFEVGFCELSPLVPASAFSGYQVSAAYQLAMSTEITGGQLIINLNAPTPADQSALDGSIGYITTTESRLGRYKVSGYSGTGAGLVFSFTATANIQQAQETKAFSYEPTGAFLSYRVELSEKVLPIELKNFNAIPVNGTDALVSWETSLESNVDIFNIERSLNGSEWTTVTEKNPSGSEFGAAYAITDNNVYRAGSGKQTFYYRLKTIDTNGAAQYSEVKAVTFIGRDIDGEVVLSPNPTFSSVTVGIYKASNLEDVQYQITNVQGQLVQEGRLAGQETTISLDLEAGVYFVRFVQDGADVFSTQKLVVSQL